MREEPEKKSKEEILFRIKMQSFADDIVSETSGRRCDLRREGIIPSMYVDHYDLMSYKKSCALDIILSRNFETRRVFCARTEKFISILQLIQYVLGLAIACFFVGIQELTDTVSTTYVVILACVFISFLVFLYWRRYIESEYKEDRIRTIIRNNLVSIEEVESYVNSFDCYVWMREIICSTNEHEKKISSYLTEHRWRFEDKYQEYLREKNLGE